MAHDLKIFAKTIDDTARAQIDTLMAQPAFANCKVRIMPDVHAGAGRVIGFTADLGDKVIPNIVGVDIGCGMLCIPIGNANVDFAKLDRVIREHIPSGMNVNDRILMGFNFETLVCYEHLKNIDWIKKSVGSLGGGNHFIEIDADDNGEYYLIIHTGSRNLGKQVADIYQNYAISQMYGKIKFKKLSDELIAEYKSAWKENEISQSLKKLKAMYATEISIPKDLCYLEGAARSAYMFDMAFCQDFAHCNRLLIARTICDNMGWDSEPDGAFETIHNYIDYESNIVRKGAISAKKGERLLIPINMRDGCIIGRGKGNKDWNESAPHGAGRIMSRAEAKWTISLADYAGTMDGIYTTSVCADTVDEAPQAYKPMQEILDCIGDTVEIDKIIKPVYNFKAAE